MTTPEDVVAHAMLDAVKRKVGIAFIEFGKLSHIPRAKYSVKPIFVSFGAENARAIINNTAPEDWASFCEVDQWQSRMV